MNISSIDNSLQNDDSSILINSFIDIYSQLSSGNLHLLDDVYSDSIVFSDPLHKLESLDRVKSYMAHMYQNISNYSITINDAMVANDQAYLQWSMQFSHRRLNKGKLISFDGVSRLIFDQKITHHQDYYDLGAMLYEHLPLIGKMIKFTKAKAGQ